MRIGHGYDVHRLAADRPLIIGGVKIPYEKGLLGHSDADVLLHAVSDALLGAAALGDIGKHFPDTDDSFLGADSMVLLKRVVELIWENGYAVGNIDSTIIAQKPKMAEFIPTMKENIATVCNISPDRVNVKATTEEQLGFTGSGEAKVIGFDYNENYSVNGRHPFIIETEYLSETGERHRFKSGNVWDPLGEEILGHTIDVYFEPDNMDKYFVDVDSLFSDGVTDTVTGRIIEH